MTTLDLFHLNVVIQWQRHLQIYIFRCKPSLLLLFDIFSLFAESSSLKDSSFVKCLHKDILKVLPLCSNVSKTIFLITRILHFCTLAWCRRIVLKFYVSKVRIICIYTEITFTYKSRYLLRVSHFTVDFTHKLTQEETIELVSG